jgi:hypothetical protein
LGAEAWEACDLGLAGLAEDDLPRFGSFLAIRAFQARIGPSQWHSFASIKSIQDGFCTDHEYECQAAGKPPIGKNPENYGERIKARFKGAILAEPQVPALQCTVAKMAFLIFWRLVDAVQEIHNLLFYSHLRKSRRDDTRRHALCQILYPSQ